MSFIVKRCFTSSGVRRLHSRLTQAQKECQYAISGGEFEDPDVVLGAEALLDKYSVLPHHHLYIEMGEWQVRKYHVIASPTSSHAEHPDLYPSEKFPVKYA